MAEPLTRPKAQLRFDFYGVGVELRSFVRSELKSWHKRLPPGSRLVSGTACDLVYEWHCRGGGHSVHCGRRLIAKGSLPEVKERFESHLHLELASRVDRFLFVHAGVVEWRGAAIVIPGRSHSGKTSLVVEFLRQGARYYSDEYALIDPSGRVRAFPRALSVRGRKATRKFSAANLGATIGKRPLPIGLVLSTRYRSGARFQPRPMARGEIVLALFDNTVPAQRVPGRALAWLGKASRGALGFKGPRGEARRAVEQIRKLAAESGLASAGRMRG